MISTELLSADITKCWTSDIKTLKPAKMTASCSKYMHAYIMSGVHLCKIDGRKASLQIRLPPTL